MTTIKINSQMIQTKISKVQHKIDELAKSTYNTQQRLEHIASVSSGCEFVTKLKAHNYTNWQNVKLLIEKTDNVFEIINKAGTDFDKMDNELKNFYKNQEMKILNEKPKPIELKVETYNGKTKPNKEFWNGK